MTEKELINIINLHSGGEILEDEISPAEKEKNYEDIMLFVEKKPSFNSVYADKDNIGITLNKDENQPIFWNEDCKIKDDLVLNVLKYGNYKKLSVSTENEPLMVKISGVFIEKVEPVKVFDYLQSIIEDFKLCDFYPKLINSFSHWLKGMSKRFWFMLPTIQPIRQIDSRLKAFYFFENCFVEITPDGIKAKDYSEFKAYIWKHHALDYDFSLSDSKGEFEIFLENTQRDKAGKLDPKRWNHLQSVLGYALHKCHNPDNARAILVFDEKVRHDKSEANGGTGKSLIGKAILKMRKGTELNGKQLDFKKDNFHYDRVKVDDMSIFFDDVRNKFPFEELFNQIQNQPELNQKNKSKIIMETIPKFIISTNGLIDLNSWSFQRRSVTVFCGEHYGRTLSPAKEFNHNLFNDWNHEQWNLFFNFMLSCLQYHLKLMQLGNKDGLIFFEPESFKERIIIENWSVEASEWLNENIRPEQNTEGVKLEYSATLDNYISYTGEKKTEQKHLSKLIKRFCQVKDYTYLSNPVHGERFYLIGTHE